MDEYCNNLNSDKLIDLFEEKWMEWDIKDCVKWFKYILTCKTECDNENNNINYDSNNGYNAYDDHDHVIDDLSDTDSDSDSELEDDLQSANIINDRTRVKQMTKAEETAIDYEVIEKNLNNLKFRSKRLVDLRKPFLFRQYGFTNKYHRKLLCKYIKQLVNKYPKQCEKRNRTNTNEKNYENANIVDHDPNLEGVVEQTPLSGRQSLD